MMKDKIIYSAFSIMIIAFIFIYEFFYPVPKDTTYYIINFLSAGALCVVYLIFGLKLATIFKIEKKSHKYIYGFLLSVAFIGSVIFISGFLNIFNFYFFYFLTIILILISFNDFKEMLMDFKYFILKLNSSADFIYKELIFYIITGFLILYSFLCILTPPVYYDELVYHLGLSSQYIAHNGIYNINNNIFSYFPALMQMNYIYFLIISGEAGVKIFQFIIYIITIFFVLNITGIINSSKKWVLLLLLSFPLFILNSIRITAELPLTVFILAVLNYILNKKNYEVKDVFLIGIITGAILAIKYTGFIFYFFILLYFLYLLIKKQLNFKQFSLILSIPLIFILPHLLRNYFFTGNPFYPFLSEYFNTGILKEEAKNYITHLNSFGINKNFLNFILSPFYAVFKREFFGGDILSPVFIVSLFGIFFTFNSRAKLLWIFIVFYYVFWFLSSQVLRFLLPVCVILIIILGIFLKTNNNKFIKFSFLLLVLLQIFISFYFVERYLTPFELFIDKREKYISQKISYYNAAQFLNKKNTGKNAILLLGDARVFYYNYKVFTSTVFNENDFIKVFKKEGEKKFDEMLKINNIKYILINQSEIKRLMTAGFGEIADFINDNNFKNFIDNRTEKIYSDNDCVVYLLNN